jgi:quercetin dioxygenase-like cupin family protein
MGEVLTRRGRRAEVLISSEQVVVFQFEMEPRMDGASPHFHRRHVDSFYVLEGELEVTVDGEPNTFRAGDIAVATPGTVHSFRNASDERVRFLNLHAPGMRFDEYIRRMDAGEDPNGEDYDQFKPPAE